jgi:putative transcriptional regulator
VSRHHPPSEFLVAYAAGSLPEPQALLIATHLSLCPDCRKDVAQLDEVGGALLADLPPTEVEPDALGRLMARLDEPVPPPPPMPADPVLPAPLRAYVGRSIDGVEWRWLGAGVEDFVLPMPAPGDFVCRLVRVGAGRTIPLHTHDGDELTLVLSGGFSDENGRYARGDISVGDPTIEHRPVADPGGACICLIVTEGKVRFSGLFGPLLTYFRG